MAIFRVNKNKNYTVISNYHLKDKNISLKAKGLLSQMLSLPNNWDYSVKGLIAINKENKTAIISTLKELEENGYLIRTKIQDSKGHFEYIYDIYEKSFKEYKTVEEPCTENLYTDNRCSEIVPQLNTKESNTKKLNTKERKKERKKTGYDSIIDKFTDDAELKDAIYEFIKMRKLIKKPMTDRALTMILNKLKKLSPDKTIQIEILNQSIMNNWQSIYYPKNNTEVKPRKSGYQPQRFESDIKKSGESADEHIQRLLDELEREGV